MNWDLRLKYLQQSYDSIWTVGSLQFWSHTVHTMLKVRPAHIIKSSILK